MKKFLEDALIFLLLAACFLPLVIWVAYEIYCVHTNPYSVGQPVVTKTNGVAGKVLMRLAYGVKVEYVDDVRSIHEKYFELNEISPR